MIKFSFFQTEASIGQAAKDELDEGKTFESYYMECILEEKEVNLHAEPKQ